MVIDRLCNGPSPWLQLAIEELIEGVEGLKWVCNVVGIKLPPKRPQELVNLLQQFSRSGHMAMHCTVCAHEHMCSTWTDPDRPVPVGEGAGRALPYGQTD